MGKAELKKKITGILSDKLREATRQNFLVDIETDNKGRDFVLVKIDNEEAPINYRHCISEGVEDIVIEEIVDSVVCELMLLPPDAIDEQEE